MPISYTGTSDVEGSVHDAASAQSSSLQSLSEAANEREKERDRDLHVERQQAVHWTCLTTDATTDVTGLRKGKDSPQWPLPSTTRLDQNHLDIAKPRVRLIAKCPCFADKVVVTHGHGAVWAQIFAVHYCPKDRMHQVKSPWDLANGQMLHM